MEIPHQEMPSAAESSNPTEELAEESAQNPTPSNRLPTRRPRALELFRRKAKSKAPPVSSSMRAAQALIEESKSRTDHEKKRADREEEQHRVKIDHEKKKADREEEEHRVKIELLNKEIELKQKKIDVQQKILEILDENPSSIMLNIK